LKKKVPHFSPYLISIAIFDPYPNDRCPDRGVGDLFVSDSRVSVLANVIGEKVSITKQDDQLVVNPFPLDMFCVDKSPFYSVLNVVHMFIGGRSVIACSRRCELYKLANGRLI